MYFWVKALVAPGPDMRPIEWITALPSSTSSRLTVSKYVWKFGAPNFRTYFDTVKRLLAEDGSAVIHAIGRMSGPGATNAFTQKYIFPGGYIPGLSEIVKAVEEAGLWITDIEILRLHYANTLREWRKRFLADPDIPTMFDARFLRLWEFYLCGAELGFRYGGHMVFQIQVAKKVGALPTTRDYMFEGER